MTRKLRSLPVVDARCICGRKVGSALQIDGKTWWYPIDPTMPAFHPSMRPPNDRVSKRYVKALIRGQVSKFDPSTAEGVLLEPGVTVSGWCPKDHGERHFTSDELIALASTAATYRRKGRATA